MTSIEDSFYTTKIGAAWLLLLTNGCGQYSGVEINYFINRKIMPVWQ